MTCVCEGTGKCKDCGGQDCVRCGGAGVCPKCRPNGLKFIDALTSATGTTREEAGHNIWWCNEGGRHADVVVRSVSKFIHGLGDDLGARRAGATLGLELVRLGAALHAGYGLGFVDGDGMLRTPRGRKPFDEAVYRAIINKAYQGIQESCQADTPSGWRGLYAYEPLPGEVKPDSAD